MDWQLVASYYTVKSTDIFFLQCISSFLDEISTCPTYPWTYVKVTQTQCYSSGKKSHKRMLNKVSLMQENFKGSRATVSHPFFYEKN